MALPQKVKPLLFSGLLVTLLNTVNMVHAAPLVSPSGTIVPDGARLLASQCFQCHGTDGRSQTGIDSLYGESERELIEEMLEMKRSSRTNDIMHRQARGYSNDEIRAIAAYLATVSGASGAGGSGDGYDNDSDADYDGDNDSDADYDGDNDSDADYDSDNDNDNDRYDDNDRDGDNDRDDDD